MRVFASLSHVCSIHRRAIVCVVVLLSVIIGAATALQAAEPFSSSYRLISATETELLLVLGGGLLAVGFGLRRLLRG